MAVCAYCRPIAFRAFAAALPAIDAAPGLFAAAWAIAQHEMPEATLPQGETAIARLAEAVRGGARSGAPDALIAHLHDVMFDVAGFAGNRDDYYNPANSYLPSVLRTRRGLPITLSLVYCRVAHEVGLPAYGVNAPGHFMAAIDAGQGRPALYVDPFHGGEALDAREALARIAQASGRTETYAQELLARATPRQWLARILHNLQATFAAEGRDRDVFAMQELEQLLHVA